MVYDEHIRWTTQEKTRDEQAKKQVDSGQPVSIVDGGWDARVVYQDTACESVGIASE